MTWNLRDAVNVATPGTTLQGGCHGKICKMCIKQQQGSGDGFVAGALSERRNRKFTKLSQAVRTFTVWRYNDATHTQRRGALAGQR